MREAVIFLLIFFWLDERNDKQDLDVKYTALQAENAHLKEELKKANSDTSHKHCIRNYK